MQRISEIELNEKKSRYWWVSILLSIVVATALMFSAMQEKKWLVASILVITGIFTSFVIQKKLRSFLLFLIVFIVPLRIDFYLLYKPTDFVQSSGLVGLPVTIFDVVLIILTLYLGLQVLRGEHQFRFYPSISIPVLLYLVLSGISAFRSADLSLSFSVFILMIRSYVAFLFFANIINTRADLSVVVVALICGVMLQSFVGGLQYVSGGSFLKGVFGVPETAFRTQMQGTFALSRVGGTIGHPNALAKYLCFCIPVFIACTFSMPNSTVKKLAGLAAAAGGMTLLLTLSRGSWVALGVALCFLFYEIFKCKFASRAKSIVTVVVCIAVFAGITLTVFKDVRTRLFEDDYGAAQARFPMALIAANIIRDHPVTGVGLNNYTRVMQAYDNTREWQAYHFPHPVHNSYLLIAAESGIPALIAFLWLIGAAATKVRPSLKLCNSPVALLQIGLAGGLITWLISAMFDRDFAGNNIMLWLTIALIAVCQRIIVYENEGVCPNETKGNSLRA